MAHVFEDAGSASVAIDQPVADVARLPHGARSAYKLMYHPMSWQFMDGAFVPLLAPMSLEPGVNAVDKGGADTLAQLEAMRRGWKVLPLNATPDGRPYLEAKRAKGGKYHHERWEQPQSLGGRQLRSKVDSKGHAEWLRWLVSTGVVPAPHPEVIERLIEKQEKRVTQLIGRNQPELKPRLDAAQKKLAAMKKAAAQLAGQQ